MCGLDITAKNSPNSVGSYGSKVGERLRPFLVTSVAVLVAIVKLVVRLVDFISLGRVRAKPYIGMTRLP